MKLTIDIETDEHMSLIRTALLMNMIRTTFGVSAVKLVAIDGNPLGRMRREAGEKVIPGIRWSDGDPVIVRSDDPEKEPT